jgi:two-component system, OmpR family, sensor histidine kinase KdpD
MDGSEQRLDPDILLSELKAQQQSRPGTLKIYFGYAAGVGKTYAMLDDAQQQYKAGTDVLVGYLEPHTRPETMQLLHGLPALAPKTVLYKNIELKEFDLDQALKRKPSLILVDELAHTNAAGVRNQKRYQDIEELLNAGIDVYTTVNVQHIESLNDMVKDITKVDVKETVPDYIFDHAEQIKLIDIEPDELLRRLAEGKIYRPEQAQSALRNFFTKENLRLLREIALRKAADRISHENQNERCLSEKSANTKLLVCIGPSPSSARCIRWTVRASESFHAPWTAVYVERIESDALTLEQQKSLRANMDLAEKLGAEVVTLSGHNVAAAVSEYASLSGITNIVIGKSKNKKTLRNIFQQDFEDALISRMPNIEVHIISGGEAKPSWRKPKKKVKMTFIFSWVDVMKTVSVLFAATALSLGLRTLTLASEDQNFILVYILCVSIVSRITTGYIYGVFASILSVLAFNFFFTEPYFTLDTINPGYPVTFGIMLLVALMMSALTVRIKAQARFAVAREHRTNTLYEINKKLLITRGLENIITLTSEYIVNLFSRSVIIYVADPDQKADGVFLQAQGESDASFLKQPDEKAVAYWVFNNQKRAGSGTDTLMGAGGFYMPVISQQKVLAVLGISCLKGNLDHNNRLFLRMIASQLAMALERQQLSDEQRGIQIESEREKMRGNLLRAISHDLRTPLAGIWGASSAILENEDSLDGSTRKKLIENIRDDSQWLIRMVENLLSVTRIQESSMRVTKSPEAAEEVVAEAVSRIRKRFPTRNISVHVPDELLVVPMDSTLITQVLINLLENAMKHSPDDSPVEVLLKKKESYGIFEVIDHGMGISTETLPYIFEGYMGGDKKDSDSQRGMGIGLSICQSIIKAHDGKIEAENQPAGGAVFRFALPLEGDESI